MAYFVVDSVEVNAASLPHASPLRLLLLLLRWCSAGLMLCCWVSKQVFVKALLLAVVFVVAVAVAVAAVAVAGSPTVWDSARIEPSLHARCKSSRCESSP